MTVQNQGQQPTAALAQMQCCHWGNPSVTRWGGVQAVYAYERASRLFQASRLTVLCCSKIAEAEAAVSVDEKKWLVMHMHVQLKLDELRGPPNPWLTVT